MDQDVQEKTDFLSRDEWIRARDVDRMEWQEEIRKTNKSIHELQLAVAPIVPTLQSIDTTLKDIKVDFRTLNTEVNETQAEVSDVKAEVATLKGTVDGNQKAKHGKTSIVVAVISAIPVTITAVWGIVTFFFNSGGQ